MSKKVIITLTTIKGRLKDTHPDGIMACIESLCTQTHGSYEVHFNVPHRCRFSNEELVIPDWLIAAQTKHLHLKVFRVDDAGPITKILPTLYRVTEPDTILIVVDDDLVYHQDMVAEHIIQQERFENKCVIGYDGLGSKNGAVFNDVRDHYVTSIYRDVEVKIVQHYKSVSYYRSYFDETFFTDFLGKTASDDILLSAYTGKKGIIKMIVPYEKEPQLLTLEDWRAKGGVTTFPVLRHTWHEQFQGCSDPRAGQRFFIPEEFAKQSLV